MDNGSWLQSSARIAGVCEVNVPYMNRTRPQALNFYNYPGLFSRIDVTLNVYSHVLPHIQQDAMDRFGQRFFGPSSSS